MAEFLSTKYLLEKDLVQPTADGKTKNVIPEEARKQPASGIQSYQS